MDPSVERATPACSWKAPATSWRTKGDTSVLEGGMSDDMLKFEKQKEAPNFCEGGCEP